MARVTAIVAIRQFCLQCQGGSSRAVRTCPDTLCPLWPWRMASLPAEGPLPHAQAVLRQRQALRTIRRQCMGCAESRQDVRACTARECPLWSYRFGVRPQTYKAVRRRFFAPKALTLF